MTTTTGIRLLAAVTVVAGCILAGPAAAQLAVYETEPNDTPDSAEAIRGQARIIGTMPPGDQDGYLWTVSDVDALKRWNLKLQGIPGALTVVDVIRLEYSADGTGVVGRKTLLKLGSRDGTRPGRADGVVFEPGEYLLGVSRAGGNSGYRPSIDAAGFTGEEIPGQSAELDESETGYRLLLSQAADLGGQADAKGNDERENALQIRGFRGERVVYAESADTWFEIEVKPDEAGRIRHLAAQVPVGREASLELQDEAGEVLDEFRADRQGKMNAPALALEPGRYFLRLTSEPGTLRVVRSEPGGKRSEGQEAEPNDKWQHATRVDLSEPVTGRFQARRDVDHFSFSIDAATADRSLAVEARLAKAGQTLEACLLDGNGGTMQCREGKGAVLLGGLVLAPGRYVLALDKGPADGEYTVALETGGPPRPGYEAEPNDALDLATAFPAKRRIRGLLDPGDQDFYRLVVTEEPKLWRFQAIGQGIQEVAYYDGAGTRVQRIRTKGNQRRVRLDNLYLLPGTHYVSVSGKKEGKYALLARLIGPPDPDAEREPNDDASRSHRLAIGQTRTGTLADPGDQDHYRFFIANDDHVRLAIQPPVDGSVHAALSWYGEKLARSHPGRPGEPVTLSGVFPPGDYQLELTANKPSDAEYALQLERLPRFSCPADCEPNGMGDLNRAAPLPPSMVLKGRSGQWRDTDVYALPALADPAELTIRSKEPVHTLSLTGGSGDEQRLEFDRQAGAYRTEVPAGGPYYLIADSRRRDYRLALELGALPAAPPPAEPPPAALSVELNAEAVAAYRSEAQRVEGTVEIRNSGEALLEARLEATTSDYRWRVSLDSKDVALQPGASLAIPVEVIAPADAWAARPVRVSFAARGADGVLSEAWKEIRVEGNIPPVSPVAGWRIPEALRGGINIAWTPLGARWTEDVPDARNLEQLTDGLVFAGQRTSCCGFPKGWKKEYRPLLTLALPGEAPLPVAGMALNHFGSKSPFPNPRRVTLLLSENGTDYKPVLTADTLPVRTEQYFPLDEPAMAKFARLRVDETFSLPRGKQGVIMGEWKLILEPGFDSTQGRGFNLADPGLGGHLVHDNPPEFYKPRGILDEQKKGSRAAADADDTQEYIIGFHHNRAARVSQIEWVYADDVEAPHRFDRVNVSASLESPVGPWQPLGVLELSDSEALSTLRLGNPAWARFVRLSAVRKPDAPPSTAPDVIRILEQPAGDGYRSILTEWGQASRRAHYEAQTENDTAPELVQAANQSRAEAAPLAPGEAVSGRVALAEHEHWYRVHVPAEKNTLTVTLRGEPTVRTVVELQDHAGEVVPMRRRNRNEAARHVFEAVVEPGSEVFLRVYEPPRNVVFSWDTSASVNAYLPLIYKSLVAFSSQVIPGREAVNLVPFGRGPLLEDWYGESYILQTILNEYPRTESSSAAEKTLKTAADALAPLPGTKSVVLITDADTTPDGTMWEAMREVRPRVFGVQVAGTKAKHQDVFQDWTAVNGGHYKQLFYEGEMEVAFDRASTLMRRPASYSLIVDTAFREAPGPGQLLVVSGDGEEGSTAAGAVELILDASGSMLQRLEGRRRIAIAREVLAEAVTEHLPPGTPVALRVFGQKEPNACRTDLEIPLGPLDPDSARTVIENIQARNLARTPIADSLARVESDLAGAVGIRTVVLVTDGEETCDGDPEAVIRELRGKGLGVYLNIVGFALDDIELESRFEDWARLGGGRYFQATDPESLSRALADALKVPFSVFDASGERVARGIVDGEALELSPGIYKVVVKGGESQVFEQIEIPAGERVSLETGPPAGKSR